MQKIKLSLITRILMPLAISVLKAVMREVTPQLRRWLSEFVEEFARNAEKTPNDIDDVAAKALKGILGIK